MFKDKIEVDEFNARGYPFTVQLYDFVPPIALVYADNLTAVEKEERRVKSLPLHIQEHIRQKNAEALIRARRGGDDASSVNGTVRRLHEEKPQAYLVQSSCITSVIWQGSYCGRYVIMSLIVTSIMHHHLQW